MRTLLLFPPAAEAAHAPLGIASLAGFLRAHGKEVRLLDLNLLSYYYLLSGRHLARCGRYLQERLRWFERKDYLLAKEAEEYRRLVKASLSETFLSERLAASLAELKNEETYANRSKYVAAASVIWRGMEFVSAAHYPVNWTPADFCMSHEPTKSSEVLRAVSDRSQNIFLPFFESLLPDIAGTEPNVVGISINYHSQMIPGITLASLLHGLLKDAYVVVGGSLIGYFEDNWEVLRPFGSMVDGFIPYEGELPLLRLVEALKEDRCVSAVPGLVQFHGSSVGFVAPEPPPDVRRLPLPDFSDLPLDEYLSPRRVLPLLTTRGCYWGRCAFCTHDHVYRARYRPKPVQQVLAELDGLSRQYRTIHFYFVDESLPPGVARDLARAIWQRDLPYKWFGDMRFEPSLSREWVQEMQRGGCLHLIFGLESAVDRVLALMEKGTSAATISRVLLDCKEFGIRTFVMFMVGFPGETKAEVDETVRFLTQHKDCISHAAFGSFVLEKKSRVYSESTKFGIEPLPSDPLEDLAVHSVYSVDRGLSTGEADTLVQQIVDNSPIRPLLELRAISRMHLAFLPFGNCGQGAGEKRTVSLERRLLENLCPVVEEGAIPVTLAFDLCEINKWLECDDAFRRPGRLHRQPRNYVFHQGTSRLLEVGRHGLLLLAQCDGKRKLRHILSCLGEENREIAMQFYLKVSEAGCLEWRDKYLRAKHVASQKTQAKRRAAAYSRCK